MKKSWIILGLITFIGLCTYYVGFSTNNFALKYASLGVLLFSSFSLAWSLLKTAFLPRAKKSED